MGLTRYKLGELIDSISEKNKEKLYSKSYIRGISTCKFFMETKADTKNVNVCAYKIVYPKHFSYVADTSRRGNRISLAYNFNDSIILVSSISIIFKVIKQDILLPEYLYLYFNRPEFDRYSRFNSWGSAREVFSWDDMCDIDIDLPPIEIQEKYVAIYKSMLENQKTYERGLEDLKLTCDANIEKLKKKYKKEEIKDYIERSTKKNTDFKIKKLIGVGKNGFISPKQSKDETNGHICYLVENNNFVFAPPQIHKGAIDFYIDNSIVKCSDAYTVFFVKNKKLNPHYLSIILKSMPFQKYAEFYREGVREQFNFIQLCDYKIPIPPIEVQKSIADIYTVYKQRQEINEKLKDQIKDICPILIKGSIDEAIRR